MRFIEIVSQFTAKTVKVGAEQQDFQAQLSDHETQMIVNYPKITPNGE